MAALTNTFVWFAVTFWVFLQTQSVLETSVMTGVYVGTVGNANSHERRGLIPMTNYSLFALKLLTALGCSLIAGVSFTFSTFVMKALAQQPPAQGIAAMQSINITVINPWFMTVFLGTDIACMILISVHDLAR